MSRVWVERMKVSASLGKVGYGKCAELCTMKLCVDGAAGGTITTSVCHAAFSQRSTCTEDEDEEEEEGCVCV